MASLWFCDRWLYKLPLFTKPFPHKLHTKSVKLTFWIFSDGISVIDWSVNIQAWSGFERFATNVTRPQHDICNNTIFILSSFLVHTSFNVQYQQLVQIFIQISKHKKRWRFWRVHQRATLLCEWMILTFSLTRIHHGSLHSVPHLIIIVLLTIVSTLHTVIIACSSLRHLILLSSSLSWRG